MLLRREEKTNCLQERDWEILEDLECSSGAEVDSRDIRFKGADLGHGIITGARTPLTSFEEELSLQLAIQYVPPKVQN